MTSTNLYFIAIVLPEDIQSDITRIQSEFGDRFNSRKALKVMPHITLKAPFHVSVDLRQAVVEWFQSIVLDISAFNLELLDFAAFPNPKHPVIYIPPVANPMLFALQRSIVRSFTKAFSDIELMSLELAFMPHVTVAYRDLTPEMFNKAWPEFVNRHFNATFVVSQINLLLHDGARWNIIQTRNLP